MMKKIFPIILWLIWSGVRAAAQEPSQVAADIAFSNSRPHVVAWVRLDTGDGQEIPYQYDRYADNGPRRIILDGVAYASVRGGKWLKSTDWGATGDAVAQDLGDELDSLSSAVEVSFTPAENLDRTQGRNVWKFIDKSKAKEGTYYTFERSRERPRPGGVYPRYTFLKSAGDRDGKLLLSSVTENLRSAAGVSMPCTIRFGYLFPVKIVPPDSTKAGDSSAPKK